MDVPAPDDHGARRLHVVSASVAGQDVELDEVHLTVEWSQWLECRFRQRARPVTGERGFLAQGSFGARPALYRDCVFERIRFKTLGGFTLGRAWFEGCTFRDCRWEGHFAHEAALVDCAFVGRMDGCAWYGGSDAGPNVVCGNDFTRVRFTDNVGWRRSFPVDGQRWPAGFTPLVDA